MTTEQTLRVRRSLTELQDDYTSDKNKKPLEDLMRAWKGIKDRPPVDPRTGQPDPNSFFVIGGYHGEPFRGAGWGSASYWGGYCNHGNILFPTWHRVYLLRLEDALRDVPGCEDVTLPFWDETSDDTLLHGIPWALTNEKFTLDSETIDNPLRSFVFNANIVDNIQGDNPNYSKLAGYETKRYPLSGLVGPHDIDDTTKHNADYQDYATNVQLLNENIKGWLSSHIVIDGKPKPTNVLQKYHDCLNAPNYTVFSNTTSAAEWNDNPPGGDANKVVPLESPHNSIHLAVGGYDVRTGPNAQQDSPIDGANGDMGENDTAGLDPIFFFHHAFVDRMFWLWQQRHGFTDHLEVIAKYPGTNSVDGQNPTPGTAPNSWLTLESPLDPFRITRDGVERSYTSMDCINIEKQLGYNYGPGSLRETSLLEAAVAPERDQTVHVRGISRAQIRGSFLISAYAHVDGEPLHLGTEAVLSRWHVEGCANCQTHLEARAFIPLHGLHKKGVTEKDVKVVLHTRDGRLEQDSPPATPARLLSLEAGAPTTPHRPRFRVEIR